MTSLAARTIEALRHEHDDLAALALTLDDGQLTGPSGANDWSVAQVLSHLGSGSEINLAVLRAALGEGEAPDDEFNAGVWARWDAMAPADQRAEFLEHNRRLVEAFEALSPEQLASLTVTLPYFPAPVPVAMYAGMRLGEAAHHGWDVRVANDPAAGLLEVSTAVQPDHLASDLGFLLGFIAKAREVDRDVVLALADSGYSITITDTVALADATDEVTATFSGPLEAALRLIMGRLGPEHTPADVVVTGNVTLDELRAVFPGF